MSEKQVKESTVLNEVNALFSIFNPVSVKLKNIDVLNLTFEMQIKDKVDSKKLALIGYEESSSTDLSVFSKWDINSAVASNISVNKKSEFINISLNF